MNESLRRWSGAVALLVGGLLAGVLLAGTITATADPTSDPAAGGSHATPDTRPGPGAGQSRGRPGGEQPLADDVAEKVRAAALARYPGATIHRVETDSDGTYEAHLSTADGQRVTAEVNANFEVTGEEQGCAEGPPGRG